MCFFKKETTTDKPSPRVDAKVTVGEGYIKVFVDKPHLSTPYVTNSMESLIDVGHTVLCTKEFTQEELNVGDIIVYERSNSNVVHSIIKIGNDGEWYCRCQGLNNPKEDGLNIRFDMIRSLCIGVVWTKKVGFKPEEGD